MPSTDGQLKHRFERTIRHLDHWGEVKARDRGWDRRRRLLEYELVMPGGDVPLEAKSLFREFFRRTAAGDWQLVKYTYEYLDVVQSWRLGYHLHPIGGVEAVAHAHCDLQATTLTDEGSEHYRATEYDLREANAAFMRLYAMGYALDCNELLPLEIDRD